MMMSCKKATELISESRDRTLSLGERVRLVFHLVLCLPCRRFRAQLRAIGEAAKSERDFCLGDSAVGLDAEARARIAERLRSATESRRP